MLTQADFANNDLPNRSTRKSPFQMLYNMHLRGIFEIRDLVKLEHRCLYGEDFAIAMSDWHEQVKQRLRNTSNNYKKRANVHRKGVNFEVGDVVLAHLRKERFPRGEYND